MVLCYETREFCIRGEDEGEGGSGLFGVMGGEGVGSGQCNGEVKVGDTEIYGLGTLPAFNSL